MFNKKTNISKFSLFVTYAIFITISILTFTLFYAIGQNLLITALLLYFNVLAIFLGLSYAITKRKTLLKFTFFLFIFLSILEIGLRIFSYPLKTYNEKIGLRGYISMYAASSDSWYKRCKPNSTMVREQNEFSSTRIANDVGLFTLNVNEIDHSKYKILCLGDSFTEGVGASIDSSWPTLLNQKLNLAYPDSFVVINAGISGSDVFYEWKLYTDKISAYEPDEIIFFTGGSDLEDVILRGDDGRFASDSTIYQKQAPRIEYLFATSFITRFVMLSIFDYNFNLLNQKEYEIAKSVSCISIKNKLEAIASSSDKKIRVFVFPVPKEVILKSYYSACTGEIANGINYEGVDLLPGIVKGYPEIVNDLSYFSWPIDGHYNGKGYDILADQIMKSLIKKE